MSDDVLLSGTLGALSGVRHAFFAKPWGTLCFSGPESLEAAVQARARMSAHLKVAPQNFLCCHQIHSPTVVTVDAAWGAQDIPQADAMVTDKTGIALAILTADCVPVLFAATNAAVIGAAHAGWRGALGGVLEETLAAMEHLGADRKSIKAALGPCIWQQSYEVGAEFLAPFLAENPAHERFFASGVRNDHYQFDLKGYVVDKLRNLGVGEVESSPADTCAAPEQFFSYRYSTLRREARKGNIVSAITLE